MYQASKLEQINISGNRLENAGIIKVFSGISIAKSLHKVFMADNGFDDEDDVLEAMRNCFLRNKTLGRYDIRYNNFSEDGIKEITELLGEAPHVFDVEVSERMDEEVMKEF